MAFDISKGPNQSLNSLEAAAYMGCTTRSLSRLTKQGLIRAHQLPSAIPNVMKYRYRLQDIHDFMSKHRNTQRFYDPKAAELPSIVVARILGVSDQDVRLQRHRGMLKDYKPATVRSYLLRIQKRTTGKAIKDALWAKIRAAQSEVLRLRKKLATGLCVNCRKNPISKCYKA